MSLKFPTLSLALVLAAAFTGSVSAAVVAYPAFNVTLTSPANTATNTSSTITLDSSYGVFQHNGNDNPGNAIYTRYYSGTLDFGANGIGTWEVAQLQFLRSDGSVQISIGAFADGQDTLAASIANAGSTPLNGGSVQAPISFQIKVAASAFNTQVVSMWFGTGATAGTEGTPTSVSNTAMGVSTIDAGPQSLNQMRLFLNTEAWNHSSAESFSLTGFTSSDAWIAPIPEPSAYAALAGLSAVGLVAIRRRRSA